MKAPPPIPLDVGFTTPKQNATATAASTAEPSSRLSTSAPMSEHVSWSAATTPVFDVTTKSLSLLLVSVSSPVK